MDVPGFLLGLLAAVPIGIATNVATPRLERWWATWSDSRAALNAARDALARDRALIYRRHPEFLSVDLLRSSMRMTFDASVAILTLGTAALGLGLVNATSMPEWIRGVVYFAVVLAEVLASLTLVSLFRTYFSSRALARSVFALEDESAGAEPGEGRGNDDAT